MSEKYGDFPTFGQRMKSYGPKSPVLSPERVDLALLEAAVTDGRITIEYTGNRVKITSLLDHPITFPYVLRAGRVSIGFQEPQMGGGQMVLSPGQSFNLLRTLPSQQASEALELEMDRRAFEASKHGYRGRQRDSEPVYDAEVQVTPVETGRRLPHYLALSGIVTALAALVIHFL